MTESDNIREFDRLIRQNNGIITKICYYFSSNATDFKDLRQEILINVWRGLDSFRHASKPSTWIYRVAFNTCVSFRRKYHPRQADISIDDITDVPCTDQDILSKYNEMHRLISRLNAADKSLILMWLDEMSYEDIAEVSGLNRNTLAGRLKRIKEKIVKYSNQ